MSTLFFIFNLDSVFKFLMGLVILYTIYGILVTADIKILDRLFCILTVPGVNFYIFTRSHVTGSSYMAMVMLSLITISTIFLLNFLRLKTLDYTVLFLSFLWMYFTSPSSIIERPFYFLITFFLILIVCRIRVGRLKGQLFHVWFTFVLTSFISYIFGHIFQYIRRYGYSFHGSISKIFYWIAVTGFIITTLVSIIFWLKKQFSPYFHEISQMGKRYPVIERYFSMTTIGIFSLMSLLDWWLEAYYTNISMEHQRVLLEHINVWQQYQLLIDVIPISNTFTFLCTMSLIVQLLLLTLLYRTAWLREVVSLKETENRTLSAWSSNLEKNLDEIREIRHDMKNVFITMNHFVETSGNAAMKQFYQEKISPFAEESILKNELIGKLSDIAHEPLKAFLFYKIMQAMDRNIPVDIALEQPGIQPPGEPVFTDLIRILGILLDNALEECITLPDAGISLKISQSSETTSFYVRNTVHPDKKETGIQPGRSTRGDQRGRGLKIVEGILEKYETVLLNSFFIEDQFVQHLVIHQQEVYEETTPFGFLKRIGERR